MQLFLFFQCFHFLFLLTCICSLSSVTNISTETVLCSLLSDCDVIHSMAISVFVLPTELLVSSRFIEYDDSSLVGGVVLKFPLVLKFPVFVSVTGE